MDLAIHWIEFAIQNKGTRHLRPVLWDLPHPYALLSDIAIIVAAAVLSVILSFVVMLYCLRAIKSVLSRRRCSKSKVE